MLSGNSPSKWEIEETVRFKDIYDQDKDGKLNREEQLRWVAPNSYGSAREEVSSWILFSYQIVKLVHTNHGYIYLVLVGGTGTLTNTVLRN